MRKGIAILLLLLVSAAALFAETEVTLGLSSPRTAVGTPVEMVLTVRGAGSADVPATLSVDGLEINAIGRQQRFEMRNFQTTSSVVYTYRVNALREGDFTIPPVEVRIDDETMFSNAVTLRVGAPASPLPGGVPRTSPDAGGGMPYFGQVVVSRDKAYVGEVIPAELRFFFSADLGGEVGDRPEFGGEGFTVREFASMPKREQIVDGGNFVLFSFQTAITPVKSGALEIPSAKLGARLQVPGGAPPGFEDFFRNFGFAPPGMFSESRQVEVVAPPTVLQVEPLPAVGQPDSFSGAIGRFSMDVDVSPDRVGPGEPVTLRVTVSGQGNLDAMGPPVLRGDAGWRTYDPVSRVESRDAINYDGAKVYEFMMVALEDKGTTPGVAFGYFDPVEGEYRELVAEPLVVEALAGEKKQVAATRQPQVDDSGGEPPAGGPAATLSPVRAGGSDTWVPWLARPWVLTANGVLAGVALLWALLLGVRALAGSDAMRAVGRRKRLRQLVAKAGDADGSGFAAAAAAALGGVLDCEPAPNEMQARLGAVTCDESVKAPLSRLLERLEESRYGGLEAAVPDAAERQAVMAALQRLIRENDHE